MMAQLWGRGHHSPSHCLQEELATAHFQLLPAHGLEEASRCSHTSSTFLRPVLSSRAPWDQGAASCRQHRLHIQFSRPSAAVVPQEGPYPRTRTPPPRYSQHPH